MKPFSDAHLETLQRETFDYFVHEANPANGLIIDKTAAGWPASIAATGLALASYPVGVSAVLCPGRRLWSGLWQPCVFSGTALKVLSQMQRDTLDFITTFWTWKREDERGTASYRRWIQRFFLPAF